MSNAEIGRMCVTIYEGITKQRVCCYYVNKTAKYISIKIDEPHLTPEQLIEFEKQVRRHGVFADRFVKVYNSYTRGFGGRCRSEKVLVRFTQ